MKLNKIVMPLFAAALLTSISARAMDIYRDHQSSQKAVKNITEVQGVRPFRIPVFYSGFDDDNDGNIDRINQRSIVYWYRTVAPYEQEYTPEDSLFHSFLQKFNED